MDFNWTEFESLRLNPNRFAGGNIDFTIQYLNQRNLTLWQIMKAGIPKASTAAKWIIGNRTAIEDETFRTLDHSPVTGLDSQGEVIYANYYEDNYVMEEF